MTQQTFGSLDVIDHTFRHSRCRHLRLDDRSGTIPEDGAPMHLGWCERLGCDFIGIERDTDMFLKAKARIESEEMEQSKRTSLEDWA